MRARKHTHTVMLRGHFGYLVNPEPVVERQALRRPCGRHRLATGLGVVARVRVPRGREGWARIWGRPRLFCYLPHERVALRRVEPRSRGGTALRVAAASKVTTTTAAVHLAEINLHGCVGRAQRWVDTTEGGVSI